MDKNLIVAHLDKPVKTHCVRNPTLRIFVCTWRPAVKVFGGSDRFLFVYSGVK